MENETVILKVKLNHQLVRNFLNKNTPWDVGKWGGANRCGCSNFYGGELEVKNITKQIAGKYLKYAKEQLYYSFVEGVEIRTWGKSKSWNQDHPALDVRKLIPFLEKQYPNNKIVYNEYSKNLDIMNGENN